MAQKKKILAIIGSTRADSSNLRIVKYIEQLTVGIFHFTIYKGIDKLPHFNPDLDIENPPHEISVLRKMITEADGVIICTPEYVFSLPGSLKNAAEWCVSTTVFSQKPTGLITASSSGEKSHEELQLVMQTLEAKFTNETALLIKGVKGKFNAEGILTDQITIDRLKEFTAAFALML